MTFTTLRIATACLLDEAGRVLTVRKRGTQAFMLPGGKIEAGETPQQAVERELLEELGLRIDQSHLDSLGHFQSRAANEPDHWVEADVFFTCLKSPVKAQAEIETLKWLEVHAGRQRHLAPLLQEQVLPALRQRLLKD